MTRNEYRVIGVMSGTSLDGLDLAFCVFQRWGDRWEFQIVEAETYPYTPEWKAELTTAPSYNGFDISLLNIKYGHYIGNMINRFISSKNIKAGLIASHGHTIIHRPDQMLTLQIGDGASIAAETGITVASDFRNVDVALGGQGAPLVPIGDRLLFPEYEMCLNLGGFANLSFEAEGQRVALDVCPVNIVLNNLAKQMGSDFDYQGRIASMGRIDDALLKTLNSLAYYQHPFPKSLGREWVEVNILPVLNSFSITPTDKLRTVCEHIADQIGIIVNKCNTKFGSILVTGGGAKNEFLIECIRSKTKMDVTVPNQVLVDFKEAMIFGFLGVLRYRNEVNVLSASTGSSRDHVGGAIYSG